MDMSSAWWMVLSVAAMSVAERAAAEPWHAVEQPELKQALEDAPVLQTESLGEPARGVNVWERWLVPNPDGRGWDVLQVYFKEYYGPTWLYAIDLGTGQVNKQRLADGHQFYLSGRALGADGRIYFGGFGLRHYTGGGFGWYDPQTQKMDGFWKPLSGYAVQWIAPALEGRLIAISTIRAADERNDNRAPEEAKLFVYDVNEQKIVREIVPITKGRTTGLITEVAVGRVLGLTSDPQQSGNSILYGVDVTTGQVLFTKGLPSPVSIDDHWPHWVDPSYEYNAFVRGPDGFVWTYLKDVLVRIDPRDARVHVVGRIDPVGWPTFVGNDVYLSGPEQLRRIRDVVPAP
jgi:hypothetical protein